MESIDSYIQRKTKQMDTYRSAVKELKVPLFSNFRKQLNSSKVLRHETRRMNYFPFQNLTDQTKQKQAEGRAEAVRRTIRLSSGGFSCARAQ